MYLHGLSSPDVGPTLEPFVIGCVLRDDAGFRRLGGGRYFAVTTCVVEPPRLLRTVMLCGFDPTENWPAPLDSVPISAFEEAAWTSSVAPVRDSWFRRSAGAWPSRTRPG